MKKRIRSMSVVVLASLAMVAMVATTAFAQDYPPGPDFGVSCVSSGQAGLSVTCTVVGAAGGEQLSATARYGSTQFYSSGVFSANEAGEATFRFTAPQAARGQVITVSVTRADGTTVTDELTIGTPGRSGEAPGRQLARTGQDTLLLGAAGLVLLTGGLLAFRRRKVDVDA